MVWIKHFLSETNGFPLNAEYFVLVGLCLGVFKCESVWRENQILSGVFNNDYDADDDNDSDAHDSDDDTCF